VKRPAVYSTVHVLYGIPSVRRHVDLVLHAGPVLILNFKFFKLFVGQHSILLVTSPARFYISATAERRGASLPLYKHFHINGSDIPGEIALFFSRLQEWLQLRLR
jgi:hypothetical protein